MRLHTSTVTALGFLCLFWAAYGFGAVLGITVLALVGGVAVMLENRPRRGS